MAEIGNIDYNNVMHAYSMLLEQLSSGTADENFFSYVNCVYSFAQISGDDMTKQIAAEIHDAMKQQNRIGITLAMYSFLLRLDANAVYMEEFVEKLRKLQKISELQWQTAAFFYRQLNRIRLQQMEVDTENVRNLLAELARRGVTSCMRQLNVAVRPLPYKERNINQIVVLTEELLSDGSEHMEQVLECCYQLQHTLGKKVFLINTAESVTRVGETSFWGPEYGEKDDSLGKITQMEWKGDKIEFFQCGDIFSDIKETEEIIKTILGYNPAMVLHIGDSSFIAGIIDEWIPVMSIGGKYGKYPVSPSEFQTAFDSRQDLEQEFLTVVKEYEKMIADEGNLKVRLVFPADYFQDETRNVTHYETGTWDSYTIHPGRKKIWAVELGMLKEFNRICEKYDITYFAHLGTLLGAVRDHGFIPWDDDIDVAMKREDYNRFAEAALKELEERYCLMDGARIPKWEEFKIQIVCTSDAEALFCGEKEPNSYFPSIDIAVLDYLPVSDEEAKSQQNTLRDILELMFTIDAGGKLEGCRIQEFERLKQKLGYKINESASVKNQLVQLQQLVASQNGADEAVQLYNSTDYYNAYKQSWRILENKWFNESIKISFENLVVSIPKSYNEILDSLYGSDWQENYVSRAHLRVREEEFGDLDRNMYNEEELLSYKKNFFEEEKREISFTGHNKVNIFHIEKKMKCAWAASIRVLKEVERICKKHGLSYFVDYGTLLGTVRHQGFVPWDDDIDIAMRREDYNRFLEIAKEELPEELFMVDEVFEEQWDTNVSRVLIGSDVAHSYVTPHTEREEKYFGCPYIVGVDIFQQDYVPRDNKEADLQMDLFSNAIAVKYDMKNNGKEITEAIRDRAELLGQACKYPFVYDETFYKRVLTLIGAISQMYGPEDAEEVTYMYSHFKKRRFKFRKEWIEETISLPFETTTVEVPKDYMKVLLMVSGKYWKTGIMGASHEYPFYRRQERDMEKKLGIILP